jgi:lactoylglutathione lyase
MAYRFLHNNINVFELEKSVAFYREALGLEEQRRKTAPDGSFVLVFLGFEGGGHQLELTWLRDKKEPYNLGDNEIHIAVEAEDIEAARAHHQKMGCVCYENHAMGIYFIADPDGYWTEIIPKR